MRAELAAALRKLLLADAIQPVLAPEKDLSSMNGRSGNKHLVGHCVGCQDLEFLAHSQDENILILARQVKLAVGADGR